MRKRFKRLLIVAIAAAVVLTGGRIVLLLAASGTPDAAEAGELAPLQTGSHRTAIVFGAGLNRDGKPSLLLMDRLRAAEKLLAAKQVDLLLLTGDNSRKAYDEPGAMLDQLTADGVLRRQMAVDYGGRRTWDSCVRARKVFGVQRAIVVTNDFHRARTVVSCKAAGVAVDGAVGTSTGKYPFAPRTKWKTRELVASWRGGVDAWVRHPKVPVGGAPVDPYDACSVWRSLSPEDRASKPSGCAS